MALGIADGAGQDHKIVYALVEDAEKFNGGVTGIDVEGPTGIPYPTVLKGVYVSKDFGKSWTEMEDSAAIAADVTSGSALVGGVCASQSYCPGVQAWYNEWVKPDPTQQDASGTPTRLLFGLEEVWEGSGSAPLVAGTSRFHVIGRYFAGSTCAFLNTGLPVCPTNNPPTPSTTTHPDQHGSIFLPDGQGGVNLVVGNDGGAFTQHASAGQDFDNTRWGRGINSGLHTLQPYDAEMAKDGTVYAGLQDNGELKIQPDRKEFEVFGGDGFFTAVDPDNSNTAYEEYAQGDISVTTDGGKNWTDMNPQLTSPQFSNPFVMDPGDAEAPDHGRARHRGDDRRAGHREVRRPGLCAGPDPVDQGLRPRHAEAPGRRRRVVGRRRPGQPDVRGRPLRRQRLHRLLRLLRRDHAGRAVRQRDRHERGWQRCAQAAHRQRLAHRPGQGPARALHQRHQDGLRPTRGPCTSRSPATAATGRRPAR